MFTDLAGFTAATQTDEARALRILEEQERLLRPILELHRGRWVKSMGDGQLIEFGNALDAVECAVDLQQHIRGRNARARTELLHLRVGIHLGDVEEHGDDILGDAVNIASRIEPQADPGGVCISEPVFVQIHNKVSYRLEPLGRTSLKGVRDPMNLYRVVIPWVPALAPATTQGGPRLAILPLTNISPDPRDEYLADGLTEELITVLSQLKGLRVISRTSVGQYKGTTKSIAQIGTELGADSVLEGSVRKVGDQLRIAVQLIDSRTDEHRWAQTYDRKLENVFAIQADVAERTAGALKVELLGAERKAIREAPTRNLEAYEVYLRGIEANLRFGVRAEPSVDAEAASYFEEAIRKDPQFSAAMARYASHLIDVMSETRSKAEVVPKIRALVTQALDQSPESSEGHTALGSLVMQIDHDWGRAEGEFQKAIELNPSNSTARHQYGWLLRVLQRFNEARRELTSALDQDPLNYLNRWAWAELPFDEGDLPEALSAADALVESYPDRPAPRVHLAIVHVYAGRFEEAVRGVEPLAGGTDLVSRFGRGYVLAMTGDPDEARRLLVDRGAGALRQHFSLDLAAILCAAMGERDRALAFLEQDESVGDGVLWTSYQNLAFDAFRSDPRFIALLRAENLPSGALARRLFAPRSTFPS